MRIYYPVEIQVERRGGRGGSNSGWENVVKRLLRGESNRVICHEIVV